jgi:methyl-accepting chemotaxis protein
MNKNLRFSHKILLAASLIVIAAFALFTLMSPPAISKPG